MWKVVNIIKGWANLLMGKKTCVSKTRMDVCRKCPHRKRIMGIMDVCAMCGCFLKAKTRVLEEKCPIRLW